MNPKVKLIKQELNEAQYDIAQYTKQTEGTICIENTRTVVKGYVALKTVTNRYKFQDQLVLTMIASKHSPIDRQHRNASQWNTIEFYIPLEDAEGLLLQALQLVRAKNRAHAYMHPK